MTRPPHLWRNDAAGRVVSWRVWVLIWLMPAAFGAGAMFLTAQTYFQVSRSVETPGEVVRVYRWDDTAGVAPLFRFTDETGAARAATPGMRHQDWDFEIGSTRAIRYFPGKRGDIVLPGLHNWFVAGITFLIALGLMAPAFYLHRRLRRWLKKRTGS